MLLRKYFGTDGIRGRVGGPLINPERLMHLGWAAGMVLKQKEPGTTTKVLIGKDTRVSGYLLESALKTGLMAAGVDVYLLGVMPTPAMAHFTRSFNAQAGIVISASHNPYFDNGVKFFQPSGCKLPDAMEVQIESYWDQPLHMAEVENLGRLYRMADVAGRYIEYCKDIFPATLNLQGLRVVVDCANGATYRVAPQVFAELGAQVTVLANQPNGLNINHQCGATDVKILQKAVVENNADVGIALDGDGDRLIMVDHLGQEVDGDELLGILACYSPADQAKVKGVVGTLMSNLGLEKALKKLGIEFARSLVGDRYVLEMLIEKGWFLGGESSGHLVNLHYAPTGDGIISALQVLQIIQQTQVRLHELKKVIEKHPQILLNVPLDHVEPAAIDLSPQSMIGLAVCEAEQMLQDRGRILLRASGTEPVIRVMVEGESESEINKIASKLADVVKEAATNSV